MIRPCAEPVPFGTLIEYWFGELTADTEQRVEEHFLGCPDCSGQLEALAQLSQGVRAAFERGAIHAVISASFLEQMKQHDMRVREYPVSSGGSVHCTIAADDDAVVARLKASLSGIARVDLVGMNEEGEIRFRLPDIPFDSRADEVLFCPSAAALKKLPAHTDRVRLLAVEPEGEHPIGDYTFIHAPS